MMDISDDSDIIEATLKSTSLSDSEIVYGTPVKFVQKCKKNKPKVCKTIEKKPEVSFEDDLKLIQKYGINETTYGSVHYNKPYVYYDLIEVKNLINRNKFLKYNHVHVVGFYLYDPVLGHILADSKVVNDYCNVKLNLITQNVPIEDSLISAYGTIELTHLGNKQHIVLVIQFFRIETEGYYKQYKDKLKFVRNFVPRCYFEQITLKI